MGLIVGCALDFSVVIDFGCVVNSVGLFNSFKIKINLW